MAPVATLSLVLLTLATQTEVLAKPLLAPGRHAAPPLANDIFRQTTRSLGGLWRRYYGSAHGLSRPPARPAKRGTTLPAGWSDYGCVGESSDMRLLEGYSFYDSSMSTELCLSQCQQQGFVWAGTEYADECYCGNSFMGNGGGLNAKSNCGMPCQGDSSETCGAAWHLSMYQYTAPASSGSNSTDSCTPSTGTPTTSVSPTTASTSTTAPSATGSAVFVDDEDESEWNYLGCAIDSDSARVLSAYIMQGQNSLSIDSCLATCEDHGYAYAGVEYGEECYCGSAPSNPQYYAWDSCNVPCSGNSSEMCGGGWALQLYELVSSPDCTSTIGGSNLLALPSSTNSTTSKSVSHPTTASATITPSATSATPASSSASAASTGSSSVSATKKVWAHHMVGNTYPYVLSNWASDVAAAQAQGIDGFALNMGSDSWGPDRVADAYSAAAAAGFEVFLSLDMTSLSCSSSGDAANLVNLVQQFASSSAQALHNGKVLVSTFAGSDCQFGTGSASAWQSLFVDALKANGVNIFFVPSLFSDISTFSSNTWMDGELNWNSGWPLGDYDLTSPTDSSYLAALGSKEYMPAISPFFYTHFGANSWNKNWLYRSDDWLYCTRWEQVIAMRNQVSMTELLTWNDYGESSYIGPIEGAMPAGSSAWVDGFDHTALAPLTQYYATAFKTGSYPTITTDRLILWSRPHQHNAAASADSQGQPANTAWTDDNLYAVVMATAAGSVTLTSGSNSQTFSVTAGINKLKIASAVGTIGATFTRGGQTVASYSAGSAFSWTTSPVTYNYNYFVGASS